MIRLPRTLFLILAKAHGVLARPAKRRAIGFARIASAYSDKYQTHGAADGRVGTITGTENAGITVDIKLLSNRSVDQQRRTDVARGCLNSVEIEARLADRFDGGDDYRQILGQAARHHGVDGDFFYRARRPFRRNGTDDVLRITIR